MRYFLFVFGNTVEDFLGRVKFGLLVLFAALGGDILAMSLEPRSHIPSIGASGGISGVIAFYALQFPRARLSFFTRLYWIQIPAWARSPERFITRGFAARRTRRVKPRSFSNGSTVAVISRTG